MGSPAAGQTDAKGDMGGTEMLHQGLAGLEVQLLKRGRRDLQPVIGAGLQMAGGVLENVEHDLTHGDADHYVPILLPSAGL
jgi:hypothetical protein